MNIFEAKYAIMLLLTMNGFSNYFVDAKVARETSYPGISFARYNVFLDTSSDSSESLISEDGLVSAQDEADFAKLARY